MNVVHRNSARLLAIVIASSFLVPALAQGVQPGAIEDQSGTRDAAEVNKGLFDAWARASMPYAPWSSAITELLDGLTEEPSFFPREFTMILPAGDVTGDGRMDLLRTTIYLPEYEIETILVDADGRARWMLRGTPLPPVDFDDDGVREVLMVGNSVPRTCVAERCVSRLIRELEVAAVEGATGEPIWSRSYSIEYNTGSVSLSVRVSGDHDGDGTRDVLVERHVWVQRNTIPRIDVLDGRDGSALARGMFSPFTGEVDVVPAGDIDGDGGDDLFLINVNAASSPIETPRTAGLISAINGIGLEPIWTRPWVIPEDCDHRCAWASTVDASPGVKDIVIRTLEGDMAGFTQINGGNGLTRWSRTFASTEWPYFVAFGDLNADDVRDFLVFRTQGRDRSVSAMSGADGTEFYALSFAAPSDAPECYLMAGVVGGDVDHDGFNDFTVSARHCGPGAPGRFELRSGRTGQVLAEMTPGPGFARSVGDVDDALGDDLLVYFGEGYSVLNGRTLAPRWTRSVEEDGASILVSPLFGDVDGDGVNDVMEEIRYPGWVLGGFVVRSGRSGDVVMTFA